MLGKWFKWRSVPSNGGKSSPEHIDRLVYNRVFDLELSNMEGAPVYALKHQLSIGSEIGNIIIADPSLSPRHATFILQQEVVSVIDHGSIAGTRVNGVKIPSGKFIILEETDTVNVGDLEIRLKVGSEAVAQEEVPEVPDDESEEAPQNDLPEEEYGEDEIIGEEIIEEEAPPKQPFSFKNLFKKKTKPQKKIQRATGKAGGAYDPIYATNSLVRVAAVLGDGLLAYSLLVIFMPFDEVREFLDFIPTFLMSLIDADMKGMWEAINADYPFLGQMSEDLFQFLSSVFHVGPFILMFVLTRLVSTLFLGVSVTEYMLGVKAHGNGIWARIGGVIRVLIGVITGPFLIFDIPAVISRRTFKEFLTFTHTYLSSKFVAILGILLFLPLLVVFALVSPLMQGLEPPEPILVNDRVDQRVKVRPGTEAAGEVPTITDKSSYLHLELPYNPKEVSIFPDFRFQGAKSKLNLKTELVFYERELQRSVTLEVFKNFDMRQLLGFGIKGNIFLHEKFPQLYNFVYSSEEGNPAFKAKNDAKAQSAFGNEFIQFTKMAFELSADNALETMESETIFIKGLVDYKASFLALLEYKDFDQIGFIKLGNLIFMKVSYMKQKPFDLLVPLYKGEGRIFKVSFDKKENLNDLSSKFYKFNLEKSNWLPESLKVESEVMTSFQVMDWFSTRDVRKSPITADAAQAMYGFYFETSSAVLSRGDSAEMGIWKVSIQNIRKLLESLPSKIQEGEEDPKNKLEQNFRDLSDAFENRNYEYFGLNQTTKI